MPATASRLKKTSKTSLPAGKRWFAAVAARLLAGPWGMRSAVLGIALVLQGITPSIAGDVVNPQLTLASTSAVPALQYPALFGTREIRSDNIHPFKKWTAVMQRFESPANTPAASRRVKLWKAEIQRLQGKSRAEQIAGINAFLNAIPYVEDINNYSTRDYWATPDEFLARGGDCEDFAIAKYVSLRALGFLPQQLRIAIVQDQVKNIPHAILVVYSGAESFVLDNQDKQVEPAALVTRYKPIFSINSTSWWLHRA